MGKWYSCILGGFLLFNLLNSVQADDYFGQSREDHGHLDSSENISINHVYAQVYYHFKNSEQRDQAAAAVCRHLANHPSYSLSSMVECPDEDAPHQKPEMKKPIFHTLNTGKDNTSSKTIYPYLLSEDGLDELYLVIYNEECKKLDKSQHHAKACKEFEFNEAKHEPIDLKNYETHLKDFHNFLEAEFDRSLLQLVKEIEKDPLSEIAATQANRLSKQLMATSALCQEEGKARPLGKNFKTLEKSLLDIVSHTVLDTMKSKKDGKKTALLFLDQAYNNNNVPPDPPGPYANELPFTKELILGKGGYVFPPSSPPTSSVEINGVTYYFSDVSRANNTKTLSDKENDRSLVVMYTKTQPNGLLIPRLLYKSRSAGNWRVAPEMLYHFRFFTLKFSKGNGFSYTQETKPDLKIVSHLENLQLKPEKEISEREYRNILYHFTTDNLQENHIKMFKDESNEYDDLGKLEVFKDCAPGQCFRCDPVICWKEQKGDNAKSCDSFMTPFQKKYFKKDGPSASGCGTSGSSFSSFIESHINKEFESEKLKGFMPDFHHPVQSYQMTHTLLSKVDKEGRAEADIHVQVFEGTLHGRKVEWHMATDPVGRVWIDRIRFADGKLNSFGTDVEVINTGILTNKPLEYTKQSVGLSDGLGPNSIKEKVVFDSIYNDITPVLSKLLPIQKFMEAQHIKRTNSYP